MLKSVCNVPSHPPLTVDRSGFLKSVIMSCTMIMSFGSSQRKFPHCTCGHWLTYQTHITPFFFFKLCILPGERPKRKDRHPSPGPGSALGWCVLKAKGKSRKNDLRLLTLPFLCLPSYHQQWDVSSVCTSPTDPLPRMY